jgi:hypothetical protein
VDQPQPYFRDTTRGSYVPTRLRRCSRR